MEAGKPESPEEQGALAPPRPAVGGRIGAIAFAPLRLVVRAVWSFAPGSMPLFARRSYTIEAITTFFFAITLAVIEGGVIGVFTKQTYTDVVPQATLNMTVAVIGVSAEIANLLSFVWSAMSVGRAKVALINALQLAIVVLVASIALVPRSALGLAVLLSVVMVARVCWSGIITIRPTIWRSNYPPRVRARIVGKFSTLQQVIVAVVGIALGATLDRWPDGSAALMTGAAVLGVVGVWATGKQRVRGGPAAIRAEITGGVLKPWQGPGIVWKILRGDPRFAQFMIAMFVLGFGNLMLTPILVIILKEQFGQGYLGGILITTAIPSLILPAAVPLWARLLDRAHVVRFRSIHGWVFVLSTAIFGLAIVLHRIELMYVGAVVQGIGIGGGSLAWNLGHVDFAPPTQVSHYMATHVTLNGLRGLIAPIFAVLIYEWLGHHGLSPSHAAAAVLAASTVLCVIGTSGFVALRISMGAAASRATRN